MKFEVGKTYKRRDGGPAELVHTFYFEGNERLVWVRRTAYGEPNAYITFRDGQVYGGCESGADVLLPKRSGTAWLNVYPGGVTVAFRSRELADQHAAYGRTACIKVWWEEGQGLEDGN